MKIDGTANEPTNRTETTQAQLLDEEVPDTAATETDDRILMATC